MADLSDPQRDNIHNAIQANGQLERPAVLTGWVIVAEWMDDEGERWLSRAYSASLPSWTADGMLHEGIYGEWDDE